MKNYKPRYEELHRYYLTWLLDFTKRAVRQGMCHQNIYYTHNLKVGCFKFPGKEPVIAIFLNVCTKSFTVKHRRHHYLLRMI